MKELMGTSGLDASSRSTRGDVKGLRPCYGFFRVFSLFYIYFYFMFHVVKVVLVIESYVGLFLLFFIVRGYFCHLKIKEMLIWAFF